MAYKVISLILLAVCHANPALVDVSDVAQLGKAMSKALVPTGQMLRQSGTVPVNPETVEVLLGSRFPAHETPSRNQFGSTLHMMETFKEKSQKVKAGYQHLRARLQKMPQADANYARHGFGLGSMMGLVASVGLVASIGIAAARTYFAYGGQALQSTVRSQISIRPQCSRSKLSAVAAEEYLTSAEFQDQARELKPVLRTAGAIMGIAAEFFEQLGATQAAAEKAEGQLLPSIRDWLTLSQINHVATGLKQRLELNNAELRKVVLRQPSLLSCSMESNVLPSLAELQQRLQMNNAELREVVLRLPPVVGYSMENNVLPSLATLQQRLELNTAELRKVVLRRPAVVGYSMEKKVLPSLAKLQQRLELNNAELRKVVLLHPQVLGHSMEKKVLPSLAKLQQRLELNNAELGKVVLRHPAVVGYSMDQNVLPSLATLQQRLELNNAEVSKVVLRHPAVVGYSMENNVLPSLAKLQQRLELNNTELNQVVLGLPPVVGCSMENNVLPTLDWMQQELQLDRPFLRRMIVKNPILLGYSLDKRYRPRLQACRDAGVDAMTIIRKYRYTDEDFCEFLGITKDDLRAYQDSCIQ